MKIKHAIAAAVLLCAAPFAAHACEVAKATGEKFCLYSGSETGWNATLQFATVDGQPFLMVSSSADTNGIKPTEVLFRIEGETPWRLPVHSVTGASNCVMGTLLVGACMPTTTATVKLDAATMARLAAAPRTYVTAADGKALAHTVKLKGKQMETWLSRMPAQP